MRNRVNRVTMTAAALVLASATLALAQTAPPTTPKTTETSAAAAPAEGSIDFGYRGTSYSGDAARAERYRDLRDGADVNLFWSKQSESYDLQVKATNIGYRDGHYEGRYDSGRVNFSFAFDQLPLNYSYITSSPYKYQGNGVFTLDPATRANVQKNYTIGIPQTAGALATPSLYRALATQLDLRQRRDTIAAKASIALTKEIAWTVALDSYKRTGNMPWGAGFAFNNTVELPIPVDNRNTLFSTGLEWASHSGSFRIGYEHSAFNNAIKSITWDNPLRATDYNSNTTTITGWDPSGYSNANGPAQGRLAASPSNSVSTVTALGMVKLPHHSTVSATFANTSFKQDDALIPWTINPVIANTTVYTKALGGTNNPDPFPGLAALPRDTAQARVEYTLAAFTFTTRPVKDFSFTAKYRYSNRQDWTPSFDATQYVRFDAVPEETGGVSEALNVERRTFDANAT
jgi:hypothetical protein